MQIRYLWFDPWSPVNCQMCLRKVRLPSLKHHAFSFRSLEMILQCGIPLHSDEQAKQYEARPDVRNLIRTRNQGTSVVKSAIQAT